MSGSAKSPVRRARTATPEQRTAAILAAARSVFLEKGFAAARIDEVAARAGVAKGTVYLHFASKEELFKALIMSVAAAPVGHIEALVRDDEAASADLLRRVAAIVRTEILETERRFVLRLLLAEGPRFPEIAAFHHERIVSRAMAVLRGLVARGVARGEFADDALARFPQLFAAPMLMAVVWESLFGEIDPLDTGAMLETHVELILRGMERPP